MRTTIEIPDNLLQEAGRLAGVKTKKETVIMALKDYIRQKKIEKIARAAGTIHFDKKCDWDHLRHGR